MLCCAVLRCAVMLPGQRSARRRVVRVGRFAYVVHDIDLASEFFQRRRRLGFVESRSAGAPSMSPALGIFVDRKLELNFERRTTVQYSSTYST